MYLTSTLWKLLYDVITSIVRFECIQISTADDRRNEQMTNRNEQSDHHGKGHLYVSVRCIADSNDGRQLKQLNESECMHFGFSTLASVNRVWNVTTFGEEKTNSLKERAAAQRGNGTVQEQTVENGHGNVSKRVRNHAQGRQNQQIADNRSGSSFSNVGNATVFDVSHADHVKRRLGQDSVHPGQRVDGKNGIQDGC